MQHWKQRVGSGAPVGNGKQRLVIAVFKKSVMQHWKQRVGSGAPVGNGKQRLVIAVFKKSIQLTNAVTAEQNFLGEII